jgi:hypothetical protein
MSHNLDELIALGLIQGSKRRCIRHRMATMLNVNKPNGLHLWIGRLLDFHTLEPELYHVNLSSLEAMDFVEKDQSENELNPIVCKNLRRF